MPLSETALKASLKGELVTLYSQARDGEGLSEEDFADSLAEIISRVLIAHIRVNAQVTVAGVMSGPSGATGSIL